MKRTLWVSVLLLTACLASCGDDEDKTLRPDLPSNGAQPLKSVKHLGGVTSCYDWTFTYRDGRLSQAYGVMRNANAEVDQTYSYTSKLNYGVAKVSIHNTTADKTTVTQLNGAGCIEKMTVNRDTYEFYYFDGRMVGWKKTLYEASLGQSNQYSSSAVISYTNGDITSITYTDTGKAPVVLTFTPSELMNKNGLLPETVSKEMGVLGIEHLYYAGLLGRPTSHLVKSIAFDFKDQPESNYTTTFSYSQKDNNTVLCNYTTPIGEVASVSYSY